MNKYVILLRGINVGGHNKLPMDELSALLTKNNYKNIQTYIQSGNIILESSSSSNLISENIKALIHKNYGYTIPVICLTVQELIDAFQNNPFLTAEVNLKTLHLTVLKDSPKKETIEQLSIPIYKNDRYKVYKQFIYLYTPDGYAKTKFTNEKFEKGLQTTATSRNWNTVTKLIQLSTKKEG